MKVVSRVAWVLLLVLGPLERAHAQKWGGVQLDWTFLDGGGAADKYVGDDVILLGLGGALSIAGPWTFGSGAFFGWRSVDENQRPPRSSDPSINNLLGEEQTGSNGTTLQAKLVVNTGLRYDVVFEDHFVIAEAAVGLHLLTLAEWQTDDSVDGPFVGNGVIFGPYGQLNLGWFWKNRVGAAHAQGTSSGIGLVGSYVQYPFDDALDFGLVFSLALAWDWGFSEAERARAEAESQREEQSDRASVVRARRERARQVRGRYAEGERAFGPLELPGALLGKVTLAGASLPRSNFHGAELYRSDLREADLNHANLQGADLGSANLSGTNLSGANLRGAKLTGAIARGATLTDADLRGADLKKAELQGARLGAAKLAGADLAGANLTGSDLRNAELTAATLKGATLAGADLTGAIIDGADLEGATYDAQTVLPGNLDPASHEMVDLAADEQPGVSSPAGSSPPPPTPQGGPEREEPGDNTEEPSPPLQEPAEAARDGDG